MGDGHHHNHHETLSRVGSRVLVVAVVFNMVLTGVEWVVGSLAGSLALIADALHNFGDVAALLIALVARHVASRQPDDRYTFGYERAELVGAIINLTSLLLIGGFLVWEGLMRLVTPQPMETTWVIVAGLLAVVIDLLTVFILWGPSTGSLNIRAAFLHHLTDAASSAVVVVGAVIVAWTGLSFIDPLLTFVIAFGVLFSAYGMLRSAAHILMEGAPDGIDVPSLRRGMEQVSGVQKVRQLHVWQLSERSRALNAHVVVDEGVSGSSLEEVRCELKSLLNKTYAIAHTTVEFEWSP